MLPTIPRAMTAWSVTRHNRTGVAGLPTTAAGLTMGPGPHTLLWSKSTSPKFSQSHYMWQKPDRDDLCSVFLSLCNVYLIAVFTYRGGSGRGDDIIWRWGFTVHRDRAVQWGIDVNGPHEPPGQTIAWGWSYLTGNWLVPWGFCLRLVFLQSVFEKFEKNNK